MSKPSAKKAPAANNTKPRQKAQDASLKSNSFDSYDRSNLSLVAEDPSGVSLEEFVAHKRRKLPSQGSYMLED